MTDPSAEDIRRIARRFAFRGDVRGVRRCGDGHINFTYIVTCADGTGSRRYTLQMINAAVFRRPEEVMSNIVRVTEHIRAGMRAAGEDDGRGVLRVVPSAADPDVYLCRDGEGRYFRAYDFIGDTVCRRTVDSPETFALVGRAFGEFQRRLADFDASTLYETIPHFHDTPKRFADFLDAVRRDPVGRAASARREIEFLLRREDRCPLITRALDAGELPLRVTHNDAKLSNILLDEGTGEPVCVIDLDTVMPGSALYDFGDCIRSGATDAEEDERDLDRVRFLPERFLACAEGFLRGTAGALKSSEIRLLPESGCLITLEQALRFLTDYLEGDRYYRVDAPDHNLARVRTQIKLASEMEARMDELHAAVAALA